MTTSAMTISDTKKRNGHADPHGPANTPSNLIRELGALFPERGRTARALVTAAVAGHHALMVGPPGTAKSLLARTLSRSLGCKTYFEYLMTKFTVPEEILGPVKLSAFQQDRHARNLVGYAADSEIVFLDECYKANSAILNALLALLNERVVHDDGQKKQAPLKMCLGASNELPESDDLNALHDRFLVRVLVRPISDEAELRKMLTAPAIIPPAPIDLDAERAAAEKVSVPKAVVDSLVLMAGEARKAGLVVSDRRLHQSLSLAKAAAHLEGRAEAEPEDLECLEDVLWSRPEEIPQAQAIVAKCVNPAGAQAMRELDAAKDVFSKLPKEGDGTPDDKRINMLGQGVKDMKGIYERVKVLQGGKKVQEAQAEILELKNKTGKMALAASGYEG